MPNRYIDTPERKIGNNSTMDSFPSISPEEIWSNNDYFHKVVSGDTIDMLALTYYNDETDYYIIMLANGMSLPSDMEYGTILRIPSSPDRVRVIIQNKINNQNQ